MRGLPEPSWPPGLGGPGLRVFWGNHIYTELFSDMVSFTLNDSPLSSASLYLHWADQETELEKRLAQGRGKKQADLFLVGGEYPEGVIVVSVPSPLKT